MLATEIERINPYIVGRPIYEPELFFGRRKLFKFIEDNLKQNVQVILLHGQRRIGKSSVLMQIPNFVGLDEFIFIYFDLHDKTRLSLDTLLQNLASTIVDELNIPKSEFFALNYTKFFQDEFLPQIIETLEEKKKKMVWLLDEFDVLNYQLPDSPVVAFFPYLQDLINRYKSLFIVPVIGRKIEDLTNLKSLFKEAPNQEISLLEKSTAKELITKPAEKYLKYTSEAIEAILDLTSGHPYFTQVICHALFLEAEEEDKLEINSDYVTKIIDDTLEISEGGLTWFRDGLPISERIVFSAVAQAEKMLDKKINLVVEEPLKLLREYGVVQTEALNKAPENLVQWGFLERVDRLEFRYKIKVKLVRYWLVKRYPLRQAIWELENVDLDAHQLFELAEEMNQRRNLSISSLYELIVELNPNHFTALFRLAEGYLDNKEFQKALEKYERAYKVDPTRVHEEYVRLKHRIKTDNLGKIFLKLGTIGAVSAVIILGSIQIQTQSNEYILLQKKLAELQETNAKLTEKINFLFPEINAMFSSPNTSSSGTNATVSGTPGRKNLRSAPGTVYGVIGTVNTGDHVQILGSSYDRGGYQWYKVYHPNSGTTGWIAAQLINRD